MVKVLKCKRNGVSYYIPHKGGEITFSAKKGEKYPLQIFFDDADADYLLNNYKEDFEVVKENEWPEIYKLKYEEYKKQRVEQMKKQFSDVLKNINKRLM